MSSKVLVTGGSGYLGTQLIATLARDGREVRATLRSLDGEADIRAAVRRGGVDDTGLELVAADLTSDEGWPAAHTEEDWTDPDTPGLAPYPRSKVIAERAAWDFIETEGGDTHLVVVNPTFIAGPSLLPAPRSTLTYFKSIIEGAMPTLPRQRFGVVDVRDVADAHILAMATPAAAGKRYLLLADGPTLTWLGLAQILRDYLGPDGEHVIRDEAPGEDPAPLTIHNHRAKQELSWRPRPAETTIVETAESLRDLGLLEKR